MRELLKFKIFNYKEFENVLKHIKKLLKTNKVHQMQIKNLILNLEKKKYVTYMELIKIIVQKFVKLI